MHEATVDASADAALARMGYKSELPRNLSMMSILGLSFAIMAAPFGLSTTMYITLTDGQSVTIIWGWVLVTLISIAIAASLAEICAVYPTAGGVYYWSAMLSTKEWAPMMSFIDGWLTLVGNWTVTLSITFSTGQLILSAISLWNEDFVANAWQTILMFWAVVLVCAMVNIFFSKYLDLINKVCIFWTAASVIIILIVLLTMADNRRDAAFVFGHYDASDSGWPSGWAFFVGLLQAAYTLTGYGMVAAMCEEVQNPHREVPKAIVLSVIAAGITGLIYLIPILFVLPTVKDLLSVASGQPIGLIFKTATGSAGGGFGLLFLILGIAMFAGIGSLTAASRCTYAFARDGAIPGFRIWRKVNKRLDVPVYAILLSAAVDCLLGLIYFGSTAAFNSFTGVATICLSTSYGLPIFISMIRGRRDLKDSTFSLGAFGYAINAITVCWIVLAVVLFCMPVSLPVTASSMNYASVVFAGFAAISIIWYIVYARKHFTGPPASAEELEQPPLILARYLQEKPPPEFVDRKFPVSSHEGQARFEASDLTMSDSVDRVFVHALNTVKRIPRTGTARPPAAERLKLYGLYKQSMEGDVEGVMDRPVGNTADVYAECEKWDAWYAQRGLSRTEAKRRYISTLIDTMHRYASQTPEARELVAELEFVWDQIKSNASSSSSSSPMQNVGVPPLPQPNYASIGGRLARPIYEDIIATARDNHSRERNRGDPRLRVLSPVSQPDGLYERRGNREVADDEVRVPEDEDDEDEEEEEYEEAQDTIYEDDDDNDNNNNSNNQSQQNSHRFDDDPDEAQSRGRTRGLQPPTAAGDKKHRVVSSGERDRRWRRRVEQALTKMTAEIAAVREQMEARALASRRRSALWTWLKWIVWVTLRQIIFDLAILGMVLIWMRIKGDRRLEEKLKVGWSEVKTRLAKLKSLRRFPGLDIV
ncbi:amino-acid permease BAT1 [Aspergillus lentulus]|uniref:Amino-acid permease BAT1 n=2 Tax=Aspergillus lentulus TaxID=293939 RepID=A0AAN4PQE3_ASPLE|nr:amino-acid permease BAT1 [Aspergillus lentulus]